MRKESQPEAFEFRYRCPVCGNPLLSRDAMCLRCRGLGGKAPLFSVWIYDDAMRDSIVSYKFFRNTSMADFFAFKINQLIDMRFPDGNVILVPVPSSGKRTFEHMEYLVSRTGRAYSPLLTRQRGYRSEQKKLNRRGRLITHRFAADIGLIEKAAAAGYTSCAVIDDITTTGATADECWKLLSPYFRTECFTLCSDIIAGDH